MPRVRSNHVFLNMDLQNWFPKNIVEKLFSNYLEISCHPQIRLHDFLSFYCVNDTMPLTIHGIAVGSKNFRFLENCILHLIKQALLLTIESYLLVWCCFSYVNNILICN